ncbi:SIR2 family protein [soil metagenome]
MRFSDDTAPIPDRLIAQQEKGETLFLCGAGISQRYGLPSFLRLTEDVYAKLNESWNGHPAEEDAMGVRPDGKEGPVALDRALFALAKRLRGTDAASRLRAERLLAHAVESQLQPPAGPFDAHADVWTLSRDAEMRGRIVTTNFDTLFERAAPPGMPSRAGPDLPPPLGTDFSGILHLHGRLADESLGLPRTALVLNSAEFGEAYLRAGWAARYVYDLARASTIVILGYGADDPPMRYILEVLSADRERYPDIREIFAFVPCAPTAQAEARAMAIWDAKGATAIPYQSLESKDHDALYRTIAGWAAFAKDPTGWRRAEAARILQGDPDTVTTGDWERLQWLLGAGDAGTLIGDIDPEPKWAASFAKLGIFARESISPLYWISNRLSDRDMPPAAIEHIPLSPAILAALDHQLSWRGQNTAPLQPVFLHAWRLIIQIAAERAMLVGDSRIRWTRTIAAVQASDHSLRVKRDIVACLKPRMTFGRVFRWPGLAPDPATPLRLKDLLRIDWGPGHLGKLSLLITHWPHHLRPELLRSLTRALDDALDEAADTDTLHAASADIRSISQHSQDEHPDGFYAIVRTVVDLWEAELPVRPEAARAMAQTWLASEFILVRRMGLHALRAPIFPSIEVARALLDLSDELFWLSDCRRETMQLFVHRWGDMDEADRARVEQRIVDGLPSALLNPEGPAEQLKSVRDNAVFARLSRIEGAGHSLTAPAKTALERLKAGRPEWRSEGEQDDFRIWSSGTMTMSAQGDISILQDVPPERLLSRIEEAVRSDPHGQGELWRLYCDTDPASALTALLATDPTGDEKAGAWQSFFWSITASDDLAIQQRAFDAVADDAHSLQAHTAISDWLLQKRAALTVDTTAILALWDRLFARLGAFNEPIEEQSRSDVTFSMLNAAEGKIGTLLLEEYDRVRAAGPVARAPVLDRLKQLISAPLQLGFLGTAAVMDGLPALFQDDPDWARETLLPLTDWADAFAPAAWSVLLRARLPQPDLYAVLKPNLLLAGGHAELDRSLENAGAWLLLPMLWAQDPKGPVPEMSAVEVRQALARSVETVRSSAAYWFTNAIEQLPGEPAAIWRERLGPLFDQTWPLEPGARSPGATTHLVRLVLRTKEAFPEAVALVAPALGPMDPWDVEIWLGFDEDAKPYYASAPAAVLRLLDAVIDPEAVPGQLGAMLQTLLASDRSLADDPAYLKLLGWARRRAAPG